jgi:adenylate cyclase, class 2
MKKELEIRLALSEMQYQSLADTLKEKGWLPQQSSQTDIYFCAEQYVKEGRTKECPYIIRVRKGNKEPAIAYKSFLADKTWIELETGVENSEAMEMILQKIGQLPYLTIKKERLSGMYKKYEVNIDTVENLGNFVEIELLVEPEVTAPTDPFKDFIKEFNLDTASVIKKGYVQLMEQTKAGI